VDNANKKGEQTAPKASRTSISEPAGTWYEGPTPQQVRKRYRVQFHETTKVREFKNDESIPARPTSTTQEATPIKDLDPIVKKRDNDSINIAQIEFSRPGTQIIIRIRTVILVEKFSLPLYFSILCACKFWTGQHIIELGKRYSNRSKNSLDLGCYMARMYITYWARRSAKQHQENSCLLCLKISKIASCWYR